MSRKTAFVVQSFIRRGGKLTEGPRDVMWNEESAVKRAIVQSLRHAGVAALAITEGSADLPETTRVLARYGDVPQDLMREAESDGTS